MNEETKVSTPKRYERGDFKGDIHKIMRILKGI
jgi:hypothetical protein